MRALIVVTLLALPAFSAAQTPAASDAPTVQAADAPSASADTPPAVPAGDSANDAAGGAVAAPAPPPPPPPPAEAFTIVLVLPLESAAYGRAAEAVRAGFLAAADADAGKTRTRVISHADGNPLTGFAEARKLGARVVVGPLVRDDLRALLAADTELPTTLALNQPDDGAALPARVYALTLAIEAEGRQLARLVRAQGAQTVGVVSADAVLQKRFASAFVGEWILQGGGPPETFRFDRAPELLTQLRKDLGRTPIDAVLLAVDGADVALLKPFVGTVPSYTSSQVNDRMQLESQRDLDDLQFVELPWLADPTQAGLGGLPRGTYTNASLQRLYALGIDAFRIARALVDGPPATMEIDGATGHLTLESSRSFAREGQLMRLRGGQVEAAPPR
ncbi:MAG: penicillin-binding protein activator [Betaproteobacteria bacterium]|nr:penicillin-binding protein activator [Betaproteobacteria bacterium]